MKRHLILILFCASTNQAVAQAVDFFSSMGSVVTNQQPTVSGGGLGGATVMMPAPASAPAAVNAPPPAMYYYNGSSPSATSTPLRLNPNLTDKVILAPPPQSTPHPQPQWVNPNPYNTGSTFSAPHTGSSTPSAIHAPPVHRYPSPPPPPPRRHR